MEEAKTVESSKTQFTTVPPSLSTVQDAHAHSNKRKLSNPDISNSSYFKIRALVHRLRPHFIEVLQTPDFRNCKAAHEIKKQMKLVMDLCKQMTMETNPKSENVLERQPLSGESMLRKEPQDEHLEEKRPEIFQPKQGPEKSVEKKSPPPPSAIEKTLGDGWVQGSYVVGGSVFGWNFITYKGSKPVYYGVTKESHRGNHRKLENDNLPSTTVESPADNKPPTPM
ncbi:hypothetical protein L1049_020459 [Liquidambar formosana]|uniref:Uncharacterized protein n=1 Tax=Liquidambar formosana TaxID=63359 RepID=A0AAP0SD53_LIQFO